MGIIGEFFVRSALETIVTALPLQPVDEDRLRAREEKARRKLFECTPEENVLLINKEQCKLRDEYNIYDENENIVYSIKGKLMSVKPQLRIYDVFGQEIGSVKEKMVSMRLSALRESCPVDFDFLIRGKKVAKLRSKRSESGGKLFLLSNGWTIKESFLGDIQTIFSEKKQIATLSQSIWMKGDTYVIRYQKNEDQLFILMVILAMIALDIDGVRKSSKWIDYYE